MQSKVCNRCGVEHLITDYHKHKKCKGGINTICKFCCNAASKAWQQANPDKVRAIRESNKERRKPLDKDRFLQKNYRITLADWHMHNHKQEGLCKICKSNNGGKTLHVDHCHTSGNFRGLLCTNCNTALGLVQDNPETLQTMIQYLLENK